MKLCIITLGCKVNSYESDYIKEIFINDGYSVVGLNDKPDVVVVNTCSVTNQSDAKSRHFIRLARKSAPNSILIACGCSAQNYKEKILDLGANIVIGTKDKSKILDYVKEFKNSKKNISKFYDMSNVEFESMYLKSETDKTRAFVKIQDGCDNYCSYCIIPYMRGNIRSKDIETAVSEINSLVDAGHKEIVLTGIHTGSYGRGKDYNLVDLISRISLNPKLLRIRISSIEITELTDEFMNELKNNPKICNHLHIPLQSGSDTVLKKMNRKYDTAYYIQKLKEIRNIRPDISITTDLIVGFPYETDEEFNNTFSFINECGFTKIHTFPFSLRNGTKAEEMTDYLPNDTVKKARVNKVLELSNKLENEYYKKFLNKTLEIIIETSKDGISRGHSDNYILIELNSTEKPGSIVNAKIDTVDTINVKGHVIDVD